LGTYLATFNFKNNYINFTSDYDITLPTLHIKTLIYNNIMVIMKYHYNIHIYTHDIIYNLSKFNF
jgi:hypothetical protein